MIYFSKNIFVPFFETDSLRRNPRRWIPFMLFTVVTASSTVSHSGFFDTSILPKHLSAYFLAGISIIVLTIFFNAYKTLYYSRVDRALLYYSLLLGFVLCLHGDIRGFLNLCLFSTVYFLCRQGSENLKIESAFNSSLVICGIYLTFIILWQIIKRNEINGGYDTTSGPALVLSLIYVFVLNRLIQFRYSTNNIIFLIAIALTVFSLLSMRTATIAVCSSSILATRNKLRCLIIFVGIVSIIFLSIYKNDSTRGRYFIYKTSLSLLDSPRNIFLGRGKAGFRSSYMQFQAQRLRNESLSKRNLADNIKHPLNDFLFFAINYGVVLLLAGLFIFVFYVIRGNHDFLSNSIFTVIFVFSSFTYPFHYPITYIMLAFAIARVSNSLANTSICDNKCYTQVSYVLYTVIGAFLVVMSFKMWWWNHDWKKAYINGMYGAFDKSLPQYKKLAESSLACDEFYYNWAYMLMMANRAKNAEDIIKKCKFVDYDTQMLRGDLRALEGDVEPAIRYYQEASSMCPNKFMPLYAQFNLYERYEMHIEKSRVGYRILTKEEKVPSTTTKNIKKKVSKILNNSSNQKH